MFIEFFFEMKEARLPVSLKEYLMLMEAMKAGVIGYSIDDFYYLTRSAMVKDEKHIDKFDRVFGSYFKNLEYIGEAEVQEIPEDWLKSLAENLLTEEEKAQIEAMGGLDKLMETLKERMAEQDGAHRGGDKWIGTDGTSPFGNSGENPEGVSMGSEEEKSKKRGKGTAVKVWEKREYKDLDDSVELGIRNIKIALRRLRQFAREGAADELDLDDTIRSTARQAGLLDIKMVPERHNAVKVLIFFDVGGSMEPHVRTCEELFSATRTEFKHLEYFYFHNFVYEDMWKDNKRRQSERTSTYDVLHKYPSDYKVIFVGDASMSPYEITYPGGSVEYWNEEPGEVWARRMLDIYDKAVWLNPIPEKHWDSTPSIQVVKDIMDQRMFPLTLSGLDSAMKKLLR